MQVLKLLKNYEFETNFKGRYNIVKQVVSFELTVLQQQGRLPRYSYDLELWFTKKMVLRNLKKKNITLDKTELSIFSTYDIILKEEYYRLYRKKLYEEKTFTNFRF